MEERRDALVKHHVRPNPTPRQRKRVQQVPEKVLLTKHQPPALVNPQAVRETEIFGFFRLGEGGKGGGGGGKGREGGGGGGRGLGETEVGDDFAGEGVEGEDALEGSSRESASREEIEGKRRDGERVRTGNGA